MINCTENYVEANGHRLCWFEWNATVSRDSIVLLVHATGFHARCWDQVVSYLGDQYVISVDMRGHGRSSKEGPFTWDCFGSDLIELIKQLELKNIIGVGHSMGGHSVTQAAAALPDAFERLVLVDPVIMAPEIYEHKDKLHSAWLNEAGEHPVARRRNLFDDAEAMFKNFQGRGSYGLWKEQVLRDYCEYGLLPNPDKSVGGYVLACPPKVEASIYMGSSGESIYEQIDSIEVPVKVLRAVEREKERTEMDFSTSPTWPKLADQFKNGKDIYLPELTHFIPMQAPELTAQHILLHSLSRSDAGL